MSHLTKYNILSSEQYGFRENLTTDNATYQLTYKILTAMNNKSKAGDISVILKKHLTLLTITYCYSKWGCMEKLVKK
jgi:hypothetical protein